MSQKCQEPTLAAQRVLLYRGQAPRAARDRLAMGFYCRLNGLAVSVPHQGAQRCTAGAGAVGGGGFTTP